VQGIGWISKDSLCRGSGSFSSEKASAWMVAELAERWNFWGSHLLYPGSTLWHRPARSAHAARASAWARGFVSVRDLLSAFLRAGVFHKDTLPSCSCPGWWSFCLDFMCPSPCLWCCSTPCTIKMNIWRGWSQSWSLNSNLQYPNLQCPIGLQTGLFPGLIHCSGFLTFFKTNKTNPHRCRAIAVQPKNFIIKNWRYDSSLRAFTWAGVPGERTRLWDSCWGKSWWIRLQHLWKRARCFAARE